ncbi:hypothetical protein ACH429_08530 [Streptomyces pathocidini]|uniref:Secreted protein n=1 Tax=Streptomyces pathocidini TaxID=1650571 RepID=A0ABW7US42_9ACTN
MPRGRHRQSPPLHRLLPPAAIAGAALACAAGAWLLGDPVALRICVAAAAAAAVTGAVLMRSWDRAAGRSVAELNRARVRDEWRTEERIAELEGDLEESRELRTTLEGRLRAKRGELARLRNEHAALLRRYATAEAERASALEGRRLLALESAAPARALTAGAPEARPSRGTWPPTETRSSTETQSSTGSRPSTGTRASAEARREGPAGEGLLDGKGAPTPTAYATADKALAELVRNAARQRAQQTAEHQREDDQEDPGDRAARADSGQRTSAGPAAAPYSPLRRPTSRVEGGFDFFGTKPVPLASASAAEEDLADVVGPEVLATAAQLEQEGSAGGAIDLTEHDETEQIDVRELRASS